MYWNGQWGTVCHNNFDITDANVICRYLGYPGASLALWYAHFGQGYGPVWFGDMNWFENNASPYYCSKTAYEMAPGCGHDKDASVVCKRKSTINTLIS